MPSDAINDTSLGSQPDLSLGSLDSTFSPPRLPSNINSNASINVLSTPVAGGSSKRYGNASTYPDDDEHDVHNTPGPSRTYGSDTPARAKRGKSSKGALTLRDQEKV